MTYIALILFQEMELFLLTYLLIAPIVVVLGDVSGACRPFVNHDDRQLTTELLSPHDYEQFTTELLSYGYSNITFGLPGSESFSLVARQECQNAVYGS